MKGNPTRRAVPGIGPFRLARPPTSRRLPPAPPKAARHGELAIFGHPSGQKDETQRLYSKTAKSSRMAAFEASFFKKRVQPRNHFAVVHPWPSHTLFPGQLMPLGGSDVAGSNSVPLRIFAGR